MPPAPSDKVLLVSYPKSGSNWVRYCIEHFSGLRTPGSKRVLLVSDGEAIIDRTHFLDKRHRFLVEAWREGAEAPRPRRSTPWSAARKALERRRLLRERRVLLLLRSPYELYVRTRARDPRALTGYLSNIEMFDRCRRAKLMVYYEDMVKDFGQITRILDFLGVDYDLTGFDEAEHRRRSLALYGQGPDLPQTAHDSRNVRFHSANLGEETRRAIRRFCAETLGPGLFQTYLGRYETDQR